MNNNQWVLAWVTRNGRAKGRGIQRGTLAEVAIWCGWANREHPSIVHYPALASDTEDVKRAAYGFEVPASLLDFPSGIRLN